MKGLMISLVSLLLFIAAAAQASDYSPVLDAIGNPLKPGVKYYVSYAIWPTYGGLVMASSRTRQCPFSVIQRQAIPGHIDNGMPITFHPTGLTPGGIIYESSHVSIQFEDIINLACPNETHVWRVNRDQGLNGQYDISVDGKVGDLLSVFKIEKYTSFSYKFVYCFGQGTCKTLTGIDHDGQTRLVLGDADAFPFAVVFFKVPELQSSVLQLPKSDERDTPPSDFCPPGKSSWPELVGTWGRKAAKIIEKENSNVEAIIVRPGQLVPGNFLCSRVFVRVGPFGFVIVTPRIG